MKYRVIPVTAFEQNCSLAWCEHSMRGVLIDPGGEAERLLAAAEHEGVTLERILLTHGHVDHVSAAREIADRLGIPLEGPQAEDEFLFRALPNQCEMFGFPMTEPFLPDRWLEDGESVSFGEVTLKVIHTPGHTPGHIVFHDPASQVAFVGDVLFQGSIGRTDFPRGDMRALLDSIRTKLWPLGDVTFIPGHGPISTFAEERRSNPYVGDGR